MTRLEPRPLRVRPAHVEWVHERLSPWDWDVIRAAALLRLLTGAQAERLLFHEHPDASRARTRRRMLGRLVAWRVLLTLERRIGGVKAGSNGLVYGVDTAGAQLLALAANQAGATRMPRRRETPSVALLTHTLGVSEFYVAVTELSRTSGFEVVSFHTEPECWWPNGLGGWLKPDAHLILRRERRRLSWWLEHDTGSESLSVLIRKAHIYMDFFQGGGRGPNGIMPRVLFSVPTVARAAALQRQLARMPAVAANLFHVTTHNYAPWHAVRVLRE